jgi:tetratricopeptide (TPR) repeat protein
MNKEKELHMREIRLKIRLLLLIPCLLFAAGASRAQSFVMSLPGPSQRAEVEQRIGLTDVAIKYHRPLVNGREVWGKLVPYEEPWRAGANENTTISFSDPVTIDGKPLASGTYGLHMIPDKDQWTVVFSKASTSWGSFSYKQDEDALRVTVKPETSDFHEALTYDFDQPKVDSAVVTLRWEKVAVPFKVGIDLKATVEANFERQFRGLRQYTWESWNDAADYLVSNKIDYEQGLMYADKSIQLDERYENLDTKSQALDGLGRKDEAAKIHALALEKAGAQQLYGYGRTLQTQKKNDEAFAIYRMSIKKFPNSWYSHAGMARVYSAQGDFANASKEGELALAGAPDSAKQFVQAMNKRLAAKEDINKPAM